jgi:Protein of unknown function (DUF2764)
LANQYYYTVSSLPMLFIDSEKFISQEEFFECCESTISEKDFNTLKSALILPEENPDMNNVLTKWNSWENGLRDELVKLRAVKKGLDAERFLSGNAGESGVFDLARDAYNAASPLEAESLLNRGRWEYLEMLESGHYFDLGKLIIYYLQLQILERKSQIDHEKGQQNFKTLYSSILGNKAAEK